MIKELTPREALLKLGNEGTFKDFVYDKDIYGNNTKMEKMTVCGVDLFDKYPFITLNCNVDFMFCAIEVPDEYEPYPDDETPEIKCGGWVKSKCTDVEYLIICIDRDPKASLHFEFRDMCLSNTSLFEDFTWLDGSPIGRLKQ